MKNISLYIHIPFCVSKCYYCDFSSFANMNNRIEDYIKALITELYIYKDKLQNYIIQTIFIGGGTPSSIDGKYIYEIMDYINKEFNISKNAEITMELNPGTLTRENIEYYKKAKINRISMGLQALDNNLLKSIGRIHTTEDFYNSYKMLREAGFKNINVDLMFGLPNQTLDDVMNSLKTVVDMDVEHVSFYGLILEEDTVLDRLYNQGKIQLPDEETEREMYHTVTNYLIDKGYNHYEISNYAKPGQECKHNLVYWNIETYLGIGLNSHSNMDNKRFYNSSDMNQYIELLNIKKLPLAGEETIDLKNEMEEFCIMGLRKIEGINKMVFKERFYKVIDEVYGNTINKHIKNGLIISTDTHIKLTTKGLDLANLVEIDFLL